jgi:putative transposase
LYQNIYIYNVFRNVFISGIVKDIFSVVSDKYNIRIKTQETYVGHIHLFLEIPINMSLSYAISLLKSNTTKNIFKVFTDFRKRYPKGHFWSIYAYYESIGQITDKTIKKYIEEGQKYKQLYAN